MAIWQIATADRTEGHTWLILLERASATLVRAFGAIPILLSTMLVLSFWV